MPSVKDAVLFCLVILNPSGLSADTDAPLFIAPGIRLPLLALTALIIILIVMTTSLITLLKHRRRNRLLLINARETILICDTDGRILECITDEPCDIGLTQMFGEENSTELRDALLRTASKENTPVQLVIHYWDEEQTEHYAAIVMQNMLGVREVKGISVTIEDITESKMLENRLIQSRESAFYEARHDPLTSIPNRLYFNEALKKRFARLERRKDETICLLMLDLDLFKNINDSCGHDAGDKVLIQVCEICSEQIRASDVFARFGGEEFICYLDDLGREDALDAAERMRRSIEEYDNWPGGSKLTISIGLAEYNGEILPEDLIKKADIALYQAKALGRNRVCVSLATES